MREILFRAKNYRTKQWVYGIPFKNPLRGSEDAYYPQIIPEVNGVHSTINSCSIIEETIGQFTGLTDMNGVKIFEGDVIQDGNVEYNKYVVEYSTERGGFLPFAHGDGCGCCETATLYDSTCHTVIGNIYDNPELIGGEADE